MLLPGWQPISFTRDTHSSPPHLRSYTIDFEGLTKNLFHKFFVKPSKSIEK